jgi:hypothetical protein
MGNTQNTDGSNKSKSLKQIVDFVATNYILTQNFQDMKKLSDMKYCNKLVILTSKVIDKKFSDIEVEFLAQRTKDGVEINDMTTDRLKIINKTDLPNLDVKLETDKRRMCIGIAKYYVKIAHIYAAIVTTIKPNYVYSDNSNPTVVSPPAQPTRSVAPEQYKSTAPEPYKRMAPEQMGGFDSPITNSPREVGLERKQSIPEGANVKVKINNLCSQRINALVNNQDMSGESLVIKPNFCKMNLDGNNKTRDFSSEPGIPELVSLYYNKYDYDHGGFTGFKNKNELKAGEVDMQAVYLNDVKEFYKVFTGETSVPDKVQSFSDIPLKAYHLSKGCQANGIYTTAYKGTLKDKLFKQYADHVNQMMKTTEDNQNKLLAIIDRIFVFSVNPVTNEREVTIKTALNEKELSDIVEETRKIIVNLYIKCEQDFLTGLEMFEAIVENQIKDTTQVQAVELQSIIDAKMGESDLDEIIEPEKVSKADLEKENIELKIAALTPVVKEEPVPATATATAPVATPVATVVEERKV